MPRVTTNTTTDLNLWEQLHTASSDGGGSSGTVSVSNFPSIQPVSGNVSIANFPSSQAVTGTFFPGTQQISALSLPLPPLAATSTLQSDTNAKLNSIDLKTPLLVSGAIPVVLTTNDNTVKIVPTSTSSGCTSFRTTNLTAVVQSIAPTPSRVYGWYIINPNTTAVYLKFYNTASTVVVGSTVPTYVYVIAASGASDKDIGIIPQRVFSTGIQMAVTANLEDNDATPPAIGVYAEVYYV